MSPEPRHPSRAGLLALATAAILSAGLVGAYLALGGASYEPLEVADPCKPRPAERIERSGDVLEQIALSALDGAACELRVTREDLALALADRDERRRFLRQHRISEEELEDAVRPGLLRAVEDAERIGRISSVEATVLREAIERLPIGVVIDLLERASGRDALDLLGDVLG